MAITRYTPNTVWLGGDATIVNDLVASTTITPGMLIERFTSSGVVKLRPHSTAAGATPTLVALNTSMLNKGVDDNYANGDLVEAAVFHKGATVWMLLASGQNVVAGAKLESAGNGLLRVLGSGVALFSAMVDTNASSGQLRIKAEVV